ncbi:MAG: phage holin family protein [Verrucomicrobia bacterium]|jgi:putative membrane protein|nr:phage holin family protein [Verrucomicrobiota bacterium]
MKPGAVHFIQNWLVNTLGVLVAVAVLPGVDCTSGGQLVLASLLLGMLNAGVRPFLLFAALPLLVMSLGLFLIVINAALLYFVAWVVPAFTIDSFGWSLLAALIIGLVSLVTNGLLGSRQTRIRFRRQRPPGRDDDQPPFIDV